MVITTKKLNKTRYFFPLRQVEDAVSFYDDNAIYVEDPPKMEEPAAPLEEEILTYIPDEHELDMLAQSKEPSEVMPEDDTVPEEEDEEYYEEEDSQEDGLLFYQEPTDDLIYVTDLSDSEPMTYIGEVAMKEESETKKTKADLKRERKLNRKKKSVEKIRKSSEKKYEEITGEQREEEKVGKRFQLFEEQTETPEEKAERELYERINADGYYDEILPIDYDEAEEVQTKIKEHIPKEKIIILTAIGLLFVLVIVLLFYLLK